MKPFMFSLTPSSPSPSPTVYTDMLVLAGQSNMDGRAVLSALPSAYEYLNTPSSNIKIFDVKSGENAWETLTPGANLQNTESDLYYGPELSMAKNLTNNYFLVKYAYGGSVLANVSDYPKGTWNINVDSHYGTLKTRYAAAKQKLIDDGKQNIRVKYFVWLQGESDCNNLDYANAYESNLITLINDFKTFTGYDFKTIIVRIKYPAGTYVDRVKAAQDAIPSSVPSAFVVDTDLLSQKGDNLHFNEQGQIDLGIMISNIIEP